MNKDQEDYPLVSVIINCYNGERYLREAIDSVYAQTYPNWEIIFVDNASVDQTAVIANSYDNRLKYFRNPLTIKLGESRNIACKHAEGEFLAFLDCDDVWMPNKLELQIPLFSENSSVGIVISNAGYIKQRDIQEGRVAILPQQALKGMYTFNDILSDYFIILSSAIIRADSLYALDHWFDATLNITEEADLFLRLAVDWKMTLVNQVLCYYRLHDNNTHKTYEVIPFPDEIHYIFLRLDNMYSEYSEEYESHKTKWLNMGHQTVLLFHWKEGNIGSAYKSLFQIKPLTFKAYVKQLLWLFLIPFKDGVHLYFMLASLIGKNGAPLF